MARPRILLAILIGTIATLTASPALAAWTHDPSTNLTICSLGGPQIVPVAVSDGAGGAFVAWVDGRSFGSASYDIYATHVLSSGSLDPAWPAYGAAVCALSGEQSAVTAASDGAGGVIMAWQDHRGVNYDIYAQRLAANGSIVAGWPLNGKQLTSQSNDETSPHLVGDGSGGAWVTWTRQYSGTDFDPLLNHVLANGTTVFSSGYALDAALSNQSAPAIASDDSGGCFVAYHTNAAGNFDIRVTRMLVNGTNPWNVPVCQSIQDQTSPIITDDVHGGCAIAWQDLRNGTGHPEIYGLRVLANGNRPSNWISDGLLLGSSGGNNCYPETLVPDNASGFYLGYNICGFISCPGYVMRILPNGGVPTGWSFPGYPMSTGGQAAEAAIQDGAGGLIAACFGVDPYNFGPSFAAGHVTLNGATAAGWSQPATVSNTGTYYNGASACSDGKGGAILAFADGRNGVDYDVFAQRIERFGQLGSPEPTIVNIKDVPNDQGGQVNLKWNASYLDAAPDMTIYDYRIWRQSPPATAQQAIARGAIVIDDAGPGLASAPSGSKDSRATRDALASVGRRVFRRSVEGSQINYWELVGTQPAAQQPGYSFTASTNSDSVGASNPRTMFYVDAYSGYATHWDSPTDSAYSVDNLPPVAPAPFTATFSPPNGTFTAWGANGESDLAGYRLYRGGGLSFTPSPANRIYQGTVPSYHDVTSTAYIYKVCAYDIHGNEGGCTTAQPPGTTDVAEELPKVLSLAPINPNPTREGPNLRFGLPHDGRVKLTIYDAQGRRVRTVVDAWLPAGYGLTRWDGRNEAGDDSGSGIYFARIDAGGQRITRRFARIE